MQVREKDKQLAELQLSITDIQTKTANDAVSLFICLFIFQLCRVFVCAFVCLC